MKDVCHIFYVSYLIGNVVYNLKRERLGLRLPGMSVATSHPLKPAQKMGKNTNSIAT